MWMRRRRHLFFQMCANLAWTRRDTYGSVTCGKNRSRNMKDRRLAKAFTAYIQKHKDEKSEGKGQTDKLGVLVTVF